MTTVKIEKLHPDAIIPFKPGHDTDAAFDLVATKCEIHMDTSNNVLITYLLGFRTEIPIGYRIKIAPRSSIYKKSLILANSEGIIDSAYRGEWAVIFRLTRNLTFNDIQLIAQSKENEITDIYRVSDRIAQCYLEKIDDMQFEISDINMSIDRMGGFGSTDNKILRI